MNATSRITASLAVAVLAFGLSACAGAAERLVPVESAESEGTVAPSADAAEDAEEGAEEGVDDVISEDVFIERDAFFEAQGGAPDPSKPLVAVTPAQKDFVAQQRAYVVEQGGEVDEQYDTVILALTLDACETSILNAHQVNESTFATHVASSPLVSALLPADLAADERAAAEKNLMSVAIFGTTFLCPDDAPQWEQAAAMYYGG